MEFRESVTDALRTLYMALLALAAVALLAACGSTGSDGPPETERPEDIEGASIAGTIRFGTSGAAEGGQATGAVPTDGTRATADVAPAGNEHLVGDGRVPVRSGRSGTLSPLGEHAPFVQGDVIVRFATGADAADGAVPVRLEAAGVHLERVRPLGLQSTALYQAVGANRAETLDLVRALSARADVVWAQPNFLVEMTRKPGDALYPRMWHYPQIELEAAWEVTTGSSDVVVAVIDTGILADHFDAPRNLMSGYDFVSNIENGDGDGRDHDPRDLGPFGVTVYHGTHVAGTVAAAAGNDIDGDGSADGIAGVSWRASVLPIRVLAPIGTLADIVDAILWAVGEPVPGVPNNIDPAQVVNLSLGGQGRCSDTPAYQDAINVANAAGASVVVAAGNAGIRASGYVPASCNGVITVGASTLLNERAHYSNWGPEIEVMAPGGDLRRDADGNSQPDGVLSLSYDDGADEYVYRYFEGTSMAAPHVAGVVALMLSVNPDLTPDDVRDILTNTAVPYSSAQCDAEDPEVALASGDCGAGRIDAAAAVDAAADATPAPPPAPDPDPEPAPDPGMLSFDPDRVSLGAHASAEAVTLANVGDSPLAWELLYADEDAGNPAPLTDELFSATPLEGTLSPGQSRTMTIGIDRSELATAGAYSVDFAFDTDGDATTVEAFLPVTFIIEGAQSEEPSGPMVVEAVLEDTGALSGATASSGIIRQYALEVEPGPNFVYAWADENDNGVIDPGDWFGAFDNYVLVQASEANDGVDFSIHLVQSTSDVEDALPPGMSIRDIEARR